MESHPSNTASHATPEPGRAVATGEVADSRWPGAMMALLMLLALIWPVSGLVTGAIAYFTADRDQGIALLAVAAAVMLLRRAFGG